MVREKKNSSRARRGLNEPATGDMGGSLPPSRSGAHTLTDFKRERIDQFLKGPLLVLKSHGANTTVRSSFYKQCEEYLWPLDEVEFISAAKDVLLVPMAKYLGNELPVPPSTGRLVFKGDFDRWSRARLNSYRGKNTHLWFSFLQSKRAAAPVSDRVVFHNLLKHRKSMNRRDPLEEEGADDLSSIFWSGLTEEAERISDALSNSRFSRRLRTPELHRYTASNNASLESSRSDGGQKSYLRKTSGRETAWGDETAVLGIPELLRMEEIRDTQGMDNTSGQTISIYGHLPDRDLLRRLIQEQDPLGEHVPLPVLHAEIAVVLEPLKVRTVSKGPAVEYDGAKPWQKAIHTVMKGMPQYRLIGRPARATDLMDVRDATVIFCRTHDLPMDEFQWLSVDYSSATDGISKSASSAAMRGNLKFLSGTNPGYCRVLESTLAPHMIHYPLLKGKMREFDVDQLEALERDGIVSYSEEKGRVKIQIRETMQTNGQLMGSPTSFPVLCQINFVSVYTTWHLYLSERGWSEEEIREVDLFKWCRRMCLINGDDLVYLGTPDHWRIHQKVGRRIGLEFSPGKAYSHKSYANINSTSYEFPLLGTPRVDHYLNAGLFYMNHVSMSRVGAARSDNVEEAPATAVINTLLRGCRPEMKIPILKRYLTLNRERINGETRGRNLFLPTSVGGMGVDAPIGWRVVVNKVQREIASTVITRMGRIITNTRPFPPGRVLEDKPSDFIDPWRGLPLEEEDRKPRRGPQTSYKLFQGVVPFVRHGSKQPEDWNRERPGVSLQQEINARVARRALYPNLETEIPLVIETVGSRSSGMSGLPDWDQLVPEYGEW